MVTRHLRLKTLPMSRFDELIMAAREQRDCDNRFLVAANSFPEQLRQRLCGYLNAPEALVQLRSAASGPAWQWPPFTGFDTGDQDPDDGQFTFAISIHVGAFGDFSIVCPDV